MTTIPRGTAATTGTSSGVDPGVRWSYDSRRDLTHVTPSWRGWLHLVWFQAALVVGTVLVMRSAPSSRVAATVYAASVAGLFGTSALYHRGTWGPRAHAVLQRLDHVMIFLLIAGTSTPVLLSVWPGTPGITLLVVVWVLAGTASVIHLAWMDAPELLVGSTFVGLGLLGVLALPAVWTHAGVAAFTLMLGGGVAYILGALLYHRRRPDPWPAVFGFHEVFHALVCVAAAAQYVAIGVFVL